MVKKRFEPIVRSESDPDSIRCVEQRLAAGERSEREHFVCPFFGTAAIEEGVAGFRFGKLVQQRDSSGTLRLLGLAEEPEAADSAVGVNIETHVRRGADGDELVAEDVARMRF